MGRNDQLRAMNRTVLDGAVVFAAAAALSPTFLAPRDARANNARVSVSASSCVVQKKVE